MKVKINDYVWNIEFVDDSNLPQDSDGLTKYNDRKILIKKNLDKVTSICVLRHELTHAILLTQGRWIQKTFTQEEMCEFIGFNLPLIQSIIEKVKKQWKR